MMGKLILGLWLIITTPNTSSENELGSANSTLNHNASFADSNQSDRTASLPTSSLQSGQLERLTGEVELEIKQLAKNYSYKVNDSITVQILVPLLANDSLDFGEALNRLQKSELELENRKYRVVRNLDQQVQDLAALGFKVKKTNRTVKVKLGNRWWEPGTYRGPHRFWPTDAPLPYTGEYDINLQRWVTKNGRRIKYFSLPWYERIKRSRPPWCVLPETDRWRIRQKVWDYFYKGRGMQDVCPRGWDPNYPCVCYSEEQCVKDYYERVKYWL